MRLFFDNNFINKKLSISLYLLYYTITSVVYIFFPSIIITMLGSLTAIFLVTLGYNSKFSKKIAVTVFDYIIINICAIIVREAVGLSGINIFEKTYYGNSFCLIAVAIIEFFVIKIIDKFKNIKDDKPISKTYLFISILIPFISLLFETLLFIQKNLSDLTYALSLIYVASINFFIIYLFDSISKLFNEKVETEIAKQETEYYYKHPEPTQKNLKELKQLRHDMKNYTIALSELIKNNENQKALEYISSISGTLESAKIYCNTGILSLDSIVNYKFTRAEEMGISVDSEIVIPYNLNLKSNDLVAILGNLLDNAIEASSKAENKYVKFRMSYDRGTVLIVISNSYNGELNFEDENYKTTKKYDTTIHGIGLKSIKSVVEKYNGEIKVTHTDTEFSVTILMFS